MPRVRLAGHASLTSASSNHNATPAQLSQMIAGPAHGRAVLLPCIRRAPVHMPRIIHNTGVITTPAISMLQGTSRTGLWRGAAESRGWQQRNHPCTIEHAHAHTALYAHLERQSRGRAVLVTVRPAAPPLLHLIPPFSILNPPGGHLAAAGRPAPTIAVPERASQHVPGLASRRALRPWAVKR